MSIHSSHYPTYSLVCLTGSMKLIKDQIEHIKQETKLSENHLKLMSPGFAEEIIAGIQKQFCKEKSRENQDPNSWIWEKLCEPFEKWDVRGIDMEKFFYLMLPPDQHFWFMIFDITQKPIPFWVFEADLEGVTTVIWNSNINEYYIVEKANQWVISENHQGDMFALGEEAIRRLQFAKTQVL